jgi:phosphate transport system permease protein
VTTVDLNALTHGRLRRWREEGIRWGLLTCALLSIATTLGILYTLCVETFHFFQKVSPWEFFTDTRWTPLIEPQHFGVLPLVSGTLLVAALAALFAVPVGLMAAVYMSEYASRKARGVIKPVLEILAGIPTVVYGYFALMLITPVLRQVIPLLLPPERFPWAEVGVFNAAAGAIAVAVMILPTIASLCDDALRAVPDSLRQAGYAMGATKQEVSLQVMVPAALSGIIASVILALSRAIGETMIVVIACGGTPVLTANPLRSIETMTAYIVAVSLGDTPRGTIEYSTIFAVGALLFAMTLVMNIISHKVLQRFREVYE